MDLLRKMLAALAMASTVRAFQTPTAAPRRTEVSLCATAPFAQPLWGRDAFDDVDESSRDRRVPPNRGKTRDTQAP